MTREEIERMPAGQELDCLIAPLLGWKYRRSISRWVEPDGSMSHILPPAYSTDMAAAWQVVKHMKSSGFVPSLWDNEHKHTPCWDMRFVGPAARGISISETAPLAICRAALLTTRTA